MKNHSRPWLSRSVQTGLKNLRLVVRIDSAVPQIMLKPCITWDFSSYNPDLERRLSQPNEHRPMPLTQLIVAS